MSVIKCCKDCENRCVGCHAECEQYNDEKKIIIEERRKLKKDVHVYTGRAYATAKNFNYSSLSNRSHRR